MLSRLGARVTACVGGCLCVGTSARSQTNHRAPPRRPRLHTANRLSRARRIGTSTQYCPEMKKNLNCKSSCLGVGLYSSRLTLLSLLCCFFLCAGFWARSASLPPSPLYFLNVFTAPPCAWVRSASLAARLSLLLFYFAPFYNTCNFLKSFHDYRARSERI